MPAKRSKRAFLALCCVPALWVSAAIAAESGKLQSRDLEAVLKDGFTSIVIEEKGATIFFSANGSRSASYPGLGEFMQAARSGRSHSL